MRNAGLLMTILANALYAVALLLVLRIGVRYVGGLAGSMLGEALVTISNPVTLPLGLRSAHSLYGGVFDANAAVTMIAALGGEWLLSRARREK